MKMLNAIILGFAAALLVLAAPLPADAAIYNLTATAGTVTMPDGITVPVWGLVEGTDAPFAPVPVLTATAGDTLTLHLTNDLTEPVSLVINGQPILDPIEPVFFSDLNGRQRVRSFMHEAQPRANPVAAPGTADYSWGPLRPGTYLISSGTHPSVQVPMGLYAVLKVDVAAGEPYPGEGYARDVTLLFSEIDPELNQAVVDGVYGDPDGPYPTSLKVGYHPKYFLLNGRPWSASTALLDTVSEDDVVLLRLLNAGSRPRMPLIPGQTTTLLAEDGNLAPFRGRQYTADLVAGKTLDLLWTVPAGSAGSYQPVHDRMLGLAGGGMLGYLAIANGQPQVSLEVAIIGNGTVATASLPGGIACPGGCINDYQSGTSLLLKARPGDGLSALSGWTVTRTADGTATGECVVTGDCQVTLDEAKKVTASFSTYTGLQLVSPNGGEQLPLDVTVPVRWVAPDNVYTFDLGYAATPGAPFKKIANRIAGREFLWNLAAENLQTSTAARLAIIGYDASGNVAGRDSSDAPFAVVSPISLTAPNGGETLTVGSPTTVTWAMRTTTPIATRATLWCQPAPASKWVPLADLDPETGSYTWTPAASTSGATARLALTIYSAAGKVIGTDVSDAPFTVAPVAAPAAAAPTAFKASAAAPPTTSGGTLLGGGTVVLATAAPVPESTLRVIAPDGGEVISGRSYVLFWEQEERAATYQLDYSVDAGQNWTRVAAGLTDTQYLWTFPETLHGQEAVLIRVIAVDAEGHPLASDRSDAPFTIN